MPKYKSISLYLDTRPLLLERLKALAGTEQYLSSIVYQTLCNALGTPMEDLPKERPDTNKYRKILKTSVSTELAQQVKQLAQTKNKSISKTIEILIDDALIKRKVGRPTKLKGIEDFEMS